MSVAAVEKESESQDFAIEDQIRRRAYELYIQRGSQSGSEVADWLQAEEEILAVQDQHIEEAE